MPVATDVAELVATTVAAALAVPVGVALATTPDVDDAAGEVWVATDVAVDEAAAVCDVSALAVLVALALVGVAVRLCVAVRVVTGLAVRVAPGPTVRVAPCAAVPVATGVCIPPADTAEVCSSPSLPEWASAMATPSIQAHPAKMARENSAEILSTLRIEHTFLRLNADGVRSGRVGCAVSTGVGD